MPWIIVLTILGLPILLAQSRHAPARLGLLAFWLALDVGVVFLVREAGKIQQDLDTAHPYSLMNTVGVHRIQIAALSQASMKGVLRGGAGVLSRSDLEKFHWKFQDAVLAAWFEPRPYEEAGPGQSLLFFAQWAGPATLEYSVDESSAPLLAQRTLVVTHDRSAEHLLRDHALTPIRIGAWTLGLWGGLWMVVQAALEMARRRKTTPAAGD